MASLPPALRQFLEDRIDSFEKIKVVVALRRSLKGLTFAELREATEVDRDELKEVLGELGQARLTAMHGDAVVLIPQRDTDEQMLDALAVAFEDNKTEVAVTMAEIAMGRLRNLAGRAFADAFIIRKKGGK